MTFWDKLILKEKIKGKRIILETLIKRDKFKNSLITS